MDGLVGIPSMDDNARYHDIYLICSAGCTAPPPPPPPPPKKKKELNTELIGDKDPRSWRQVNTAWSATLFDWQLSVVQLT